MKCGVFMDEIKNTIHLMKKGLINPDNKLSLIPNWLSFSRAIGGVLIPVLIYTGAPVIFLTGTILFTALSDFFDGKAARFLVCGETKEGAMLDAVSDKIFSLSLMIFIIPTLPIFLMNVTLEGVISLINGKLLSKGGEPKSNYLGKIKIWPLFTALGLSYLGLSLGNNTQISNILMNVASGLSIFTGALECVNIKQYYDTYKEVSSELSDNPSVNSDSDLPSVKLDNKTNSYKLYKNNNAVMVFDNQTMEDEYEEKYEKNQGKQKRMKL